MTEVEVDKLSSADVYAVKDRAEKSPCKTMAL
jgi:hypothetical protein